MSVRITLNCQLKPEKFEQLLAFLEENLPNVRAFQGNTFVKVLFDDNNNEMLLEEEWHSVEEHQQYLQFIEQNGVMAGLALFFKSPPQIKYFKLKAI